MEIKKNITTNLTSLAWFGLLSNGDLAFLYNFNSSLVILDSNRHFIKQIIPLFEKYYLTGLALPNDFLLLSQYANTYNDIIILDTKSGRFKTFYTFKEWEQYAIQMKILPNGNLGVISSDQMFRILNIRDGSLIKNFSFPSTVNTFEIFNENQIVVGLRDGNVEIWNFETNSLVNRFRGQSESHGVLFNGLKVFNNSEIMGFYFSGLIKIWNTENSELIFEIKAHDFGLIDSLTLSNGKIITLALNEISLWE